MTNPLEHVDEDRIQAIEDRVAILEDVIDRLNVAACARRAAERVGGPAQAALIALAEELEQ